MSNDNKKQKIGIYLTISLVVGNMIGSGIFLLPSSLAHYGGISIYGWLISGVGAVLLALLFGRLSKIIPKTGGPYQYPKAGFGEFVGFISGWGYWTSIVLTNASIAMVFTGYFLVFFPGLEDSWLASLIIALSAIWGLTWLNSLGVRAGGKLQLVTSILKIVPLILVSVMGLFFFDVSHFKPMNLSGDSDFIAIGAVITLTLFAFLGIESATVPAENIKNPKKTIPQATLIGVILTLIIYMITSVSIMGVIPPNELATSNAPLADAAFVIWGEPGRIFIGLGALISTFGALNGWILVQGQMPLAMAQDKLFPPVFSKMSKRNFPLAGLVISSGLISLVLLVSHSRNLVELFSLLVLLSTFLSLITYLFSSMAEVMILIKHKVDGWQRKLIPTFFSSIPVFAFSLWAIYGSGLEVVFYGFIALMLGIPFYVWSKIEQSKS